MLGTGIGIPSLVTIVFQEAPPEMETGVRVTGHRVGSGRVTGQKS